MKDSIAVLAMAAVIIAGVIFYYQWKIGKMEHQITTINKEKNDTIRYWKNEHGREVAEKRAAQASTKQLQEAYPEIVKELKEEFNVKFKNMEAYVRNEIKASGSGNSTVHHYHYDDSTGNKISVWQLKASDGYLDFTADVYDSLRAPFKYVYRDTITTVIHSKKKNWFAKEQLFSSTSLKNPNAKAVATTNILVDNYKDKRWVVYGGVGFDVITVRPTLNVGVGFAFIKF